MIKHSTGDPPRGGSKKPDEVEVQRLVAACQNGDAEAFGGIYDLYIDSVYRYVYYRVSQEEVEDITENIFVRVWENIDKYTPGKHPFSAWLFRIAHNLVVDHYRFHRKHISLRERLPQHVSQSDDDPADWASQRLNQTQVREALLELKEPYQQVLVLKFLSSFSNKEIAEVMDRTEGNIRILQYRALKALRVILEKKGMSPRNT
ncbi:sigma-70 family RNA polymerase sigma factor [Candidatus Peregrinibacteria bacterium]|nr:sigma-70 family RNA polymerase sigma factor [Candidatus Peregrinibacteria bacterium]MBT7483882.1 sigma-70 family RNA polymerase sigma factor [Candidatus Peregrinibacteria bacterium]MBT7702683.1 sigma-70 family RNA polymerase sigma factor [Candidatus Peregrinibacteria bacterium]